MAEPLTGGDVGTAPGAAADAATSTTLPSHDAGGVCPFLIASTGDWRLAGPTREHRCAAFVPLTSLSLEKQARLCLRVAHVTCATYIASVAARAERAGPGSGEPLERVGRWGLARTAPLIEDTGGMRGTLITMIADRRTWPAIPAVLLVATLLAVGISGIRNDGQAAALESPTPFQSSPGPESTDGTESTPRETMTASGAPSNPPSETPSVAPTVAPTPSAAYRIYTVQSGDTLAGIASKFHVSLSELEKLNSISNARQLHIGQKLKIPNA
jgi:LysM repeat protein